MSQELPPHVSDQLRSEESLILYIPEPDLMERRRIFRAAIPLFIASAILLVLAINAQKDVITGAAGIFLVVASFVYPLRLCRTSYMLTDRRVLRLVGGQTVENVGLSESERPVMVDHSAGCSVIWRLSARVLLLGPLVVLRRRRAEAWSPRAFVASRDLTRMRIGYPGHTLPIAKIFDAVTGAWEAARCFGTHKPGYESVAGIDKVSP